MKWLNELCGIPVDSVLNVSIPKEKLVANVRTKFVQMAATRELDYVEDIVYHAILRDRQELQTFHELHIIEVKLQEPKYIKIIAEAFEQAIPYSKIVIFSSMGKYLLFESYADGEPVKKFQFSDWVYDEELMTDFSLGIRRQTETDINPNHWESWEHLPALMSSLFRTSAYSGYLCLRHLVDILKIREMQCDKELIHPLIAQLVEYGKIEYFDDVPFVTWSDADSVYRAAFPYKYVSSGIEDERFGIDRQFEPLTKGDFTSYEEVSCLLEEIECSLSYQGYDPDKYNSEDDEYNDDPEKYGDDENYDYVEHYDYNG